MAAQMNIQYKETLIDGLIRSTEGCMNSLLKFSLPIETQFPLIDIAKRRLILGWEVINIPALFFKATKDGATLRYYYCTGEYVVNFEGTGSGRDHESNKQHEYDNGIVAKNKIRKWLDEHTRTEI